jgi:hypothetical protein
MKSVCSTGQFCCAALTYARGQSFAKHVELEISPLSLTKARREMGWVLGNMAQNMRKEMLSIDCGIARRCAQLYSRGCNLTTDAE